MYILVVIDDPVKGLREFSFHGPLEIALETINTLIARKENILQAQLIDRGKHLDLPLEAFDGTSVIEPLRQLEQQWQVILEQPLSTSMTNQQVPIQELQKRVMLYADLCNFYCRWIERLRMNLVRINEDNSNADQEVRLVGYFEELIVRRELNLTQSRQLHKQAKQRLDLLNT